MAASRLAATSLAVRGAPSAKVQPLRRRMVTVAPLTVTESARRISSSIRGEMRTSFSNSRPATCSVRVLAFR